MTLSSPSFFAASTSLSRPPRSAALVALAASLPEPLLEGGGEQAVNAANRIDAPARLRVKIERTAGGEHAARHDPAHRDHRALRKTVHCGARQTAEPTEDLLRPVGTGDDEPLVGSEPEHADPVAAAVALLGCGGR